MAMLLHRKKVTHNKPKNFAKFDVEFGNSFKVSYWTFLKDVLKVYEEEHFAHIFIIIQNKLLLIKHTKTNLLSRKI